jgi:hypothetical protein
MIKNISTSIFACAIALLTAPYLLLAEEESSPRPDKKGNYYSMVWPEWLVVIKDSKGLPCRTGAGTNYSIFKKFYRNDIVYQFTQSGEEGTVNDRYGKPWLVALPSGYQYDTPCYIRASNKLIKPIPRENWTSH